MQRIFQRYAETRSFSAVSGELNDAGIPAFAGGRWYPITVRTMLRNETYTGRTLFRRTQRIKVRDQATGKRRSRVIARPEADCIEIADATPRIITEALWQQVAAILGDPERLRRRPEGRFYTLSTRARCGLCGTAMVGQTLTVKGKEFRYYRCRHAYTKTTSYQCAARYVRGPKLEAAVWAEVRRVLSDPGVVLEEITRQRQVNIDGDLNRLEKERAGLVSREQRLVRLFSLGDVDEDVVHGELAGVRRQRVLIDERLGMLQRATISAIPEPDTESLTQVCSAIGTWVDHASEQERTKVLEALQVTVEATREQAVLSGVLPTVPPQFITDEGSCRCSFNGEPYTT